MPDYRFFEVLEGLREQRQRDPHFDPTRLTYQTNITLAQRRLGQNDWPESLSYYCSMDVAISIIGNGFIWLTDVRKMNDSSELHFAMEYLGREIAEIGREAPVQKLIGNVAEQNLRVFTAPSTTTDGDEVFREKFVMAMCLSNVSDDANMWRLYGDRGAGVEIRFNRDRLSVALDTARRSMPNAGTHEVGMTQVCYPNPSCSCLSDLAQQIEEALNITEDNCEREILRVAFDTEFLKLLMGHKHPSFSGENEFRMFTHIPSVKTWLGNDRLFRHTDKSRSFHYSEIFLPHQAIGVSHEEFWRGLISELVVGPNADTDKVAALNEALISRGIADVLTTSSVPLRSFS